MNENTTPQQPQGWSSWPAPDASTRAYTYTPPPPPPHGRPPRRSHNVLTMLAAVVLGALLAVAGYAIVTHNESTPAQDTRTPPRIPATAPSTSPSTTPQSPSNGSQPGNQPGGGVFPTPTSPNGNGSSNGSTNGQANSTQSVGVVDINTRLAYQQAEAAGTGIIVTSSGEVMTNNHVIDGATSISVTVVSDRRNVQGRRWSARTRPPTWRCCNSRTPRASRSPSWGLLEVKIGDAVTAVGNAGGVGGTPSLSRAP